MIQVKADCGHWVDVLGDKQLGCKECTEKEHNQKQNI